MIKPGREYSEFRRKLIKEENLSYRQALAIFEALHKEALCLGAISAENIMEGLETDLRIAKAINGLT